MKGTIIQGTMRLQDLIPAYYDFLYAQDKLPFGVYDWEEEEFPDDDSWWESMDAWYVFEDLLMAMQDAAPDGYCFGAHPGDGSDFGYWECEE